jgi:hypothetical protein
MSTIQAFFFHWHLFIYFISKNNCRLLTINNVSFMFFYYRESNKIYSPSIYILAVQSAKVNLPKYTEHHVMGIEQIK